MLALQVRTCTLHALADVTMTSGMDVITVFRNELAPHVPSSLSFGITAEGDVMYVITGQVNFPHVGALTRRAWPSLFGLAPAIQPLEMVDEEDAFCPSVVMAEPRSSVTSQVKRRAREGVSRSSVEPWLAPCRGREVRLLLNWPR